MPIMTLMSLLGSEPTTTSVPVLQLLLGAAGIVSMIMYAIHRHGVSRTHESRRKSRSVFLFSRNLRQWLGGHHDVAGHARTTGR